MTGGRCRLSRDCHGFRCRRCNFFPQAKNLPTLLLNRRLQLCDGNSVLCRHGVHRRDVLPFLALQTAFKVRDVPLQRFTSRTRLPMLSLRLLPSRDCALQLQAEGRSTHAKSRNNSKPEGTGDRDRNEERERKGESERGRGVCTKIILLF